MKNYAIFHKPESEYAFAKDDHTLRILLRLARDEEYESVSILYNNKYDFTRYRYSGEMSKEFSDELFDYYAFEIKLNDVRFAYIFVLRKGRKVWYYSEEGISEEYDFERAYYTFYQYPYINSADVVRVTEWAYKAIFYQIFVDRFYRGDYKKDDSYITQEWRDRIGAKSYAGGDLKGITQKLPYLKDLGVNALYLTPVFKANSNHKYNTTDYRTVDPQFGSNADLVELVTRAHDMGMRVMLDIVFNHCDASHPFFQDVLKYGKQSRYYSYFIIDGDKPDLQSGNYARFADCKYMPKWNTNDAEARQYLIQIGTEYLRVYNVDGLRLDVADEVSHTFWQDFRRAVKEVNPDALLIGEVWHDNTHYLRGDQFDGVMNYKLQKILLDYFASGEATAEQVAERMSRLWVQNIEQVNYMALNFLDNHDTARFYRSANGNTDLLLGAIACMIVSPGMPCIFYGTELPLDGASDPDCRRTFDWSFTSQDKGYAEKLKELLSLRARETLQSGKFRVRAENGLLVVERAGKGEIVTAYFNRSDRPSAAVGGKVLFENQCKMSAKGSVILPNGTLVVTKE